MVFRILFVRYRCLMCRPRASTHRNRAFRSRKSAASDDRAFRWVWSIAKRARESAETTFGEERRMHWHGESTAIVGAHAKGTSVVFGAAIWDFVRKWRDHFFRLVLFDEWLSLIRCGEKSVPCGNSSRWRAPPVLVGHTQKVQYGCVPTSLAWYGSEHEHGVLHQLNHESAEPWKHAHRQFRDLL